MDALICVMDIEFFIAIKFYKSLLHRNAVIQT